LVKGVRIGGHFGGLSGYGWQGTICETRISKSINSGVLNNNSTSPVLPRKHTHVATEKTLIPHSGSGWPKNPTAFDSQYFYVDDDDTALFLPENISINNAVNITDVCNTEIVTILMTEIIDNVVIQEIVSSIYPVTDVVAIAISDTQINLTWIDPETRQHQIQIWREGVF
jgi:hypothetical protein